MNYYQKAVELFDDENDQYKYLNNILCEKMNSTPEWIKNDEYKLDEIDVSYTFEFIKNDFIELLKQMIPDEEKIKYDIFSWNNREQKEGILNLLIKLDNKYLIFYLFLVVPYYFDSKDKENIREILVDNLNMLIEKYPEANYFDYVQENIHIDRYSDRISMGSCSNRSDAYKSFIFIRKYQYT